MVGRILCTEQEMERLRRRLIKLFIRGLGTCGTQKLVMQQRGKCGVILRAQIRRRSLRMLAEGGALLRRMARPGPSNGAVASDCNR